MGKDTRSHRLESNKGDGDMKTFLEHLEEEIRDMAVDNVVSFLDLDIEPDEKLVKERMDILYKKLARELVSKNYI